MGYNLCLVAEPRASDVSAVSNKIIRLFAIKTRCLGQNFGFVFRFVGFDFLQNLDVNFDETSSEVVFSRFALLKLLGDSTLSLKGILQWRISNSRIYSSCFGFCFDTREWCGNSSDFPSG